jgi:uncharacterized Zn-binding protein involved in type VI secretion
MPGVSIARLGDLVTLGVITGPGAIPPFGVNVNGIPVSLIGDAVSAHGEPPHTVSFIAQGAPRIKCSGISPAHIGALATCGHPVSSGSLNTFIGLV